MVDRAETAYVKLWDMRVGAVLWDSDRGLASFEYDPSFLNSGLDPAPLTMPTDEARRGNAVFEFPHLSQKTFYGLPGMLADSLPDKYGNKIINAWLARKGRTTRLGGHAEPVGCGLPQGGQPHLANQGGQLKSAQHHLATLAPLR